LGGHNRAVRIQVVYFALNGEVDGGDTMMFSPGTRMVDR
jgi:hypothetical protein